ncbi:kinase-like protein, partial [Amniculicola lignicola CBS 123094]
MADSENSKAQTILYLRPQTAKDIELLDIPDNEPYRFEVAPPSEPTDIPLGVISELSPTTHLSPYDNTPHDDGRVSRESTPGLYPISRGVIRLGFDSIEKPAARGFEIGFGPSSDVKVPYYGRNPNEAYFRIHYNFNSGALLITALDSMIVGSARLSKQESLLLMAGASIRCGGAFSFVVEFPDLGNCAEEHERNYQEYTAKIGIPDAQYMETPRSEYPPIGAEHRSVATLGKGAFGEVHKALNNKTGEAFAIKILRGEGESEMKEVNIMSSLCHENIIKYERAFKIPSSQTCIVMELAVNDLNTHQKARQNGMRGSSLSLVCIRSIGRQALSGLNYLHDKGVMHRDLKPENILVTEWDAKTDIPTIKLADFGLAGIGSEHDTYCGTDGYIAPETVPQNRLLMYTNSVDIWALG